MASNPSYYLTTPSAAVQLPKIEMHEADLGEERGDISFETDGGKRYTYNQFKREKKRLTFRNLTAAQLAIFRTMHTAVGGQTTAFFFIDSDGTTIYCKKQKDFLFRRLRSNNTYEVVLELTEEPSDASIGA